MSKRQQQLLFVILERLEILLSSSILITLSVVRLRYLHQGRRQVETFLNRKAANIKELSAMHNLRGFFIGMYLLKSWNALYTHVLMTQVALRLYCFTTIMTLLLFTARSISALITLSNYLLHALAPCMPISLAKAWETSLSYAKGPTTRQLSRANRKTSADSKQIRLC